MLARFFLMADAALKDEGIVLGFGSFDELVEANVRNKDSWAPIAPTFDPLNGLCDPDRSYALIGRNPDGDVVIAQGTRVFDWSQTTLKTETESLRLYYSDPARQSRPGEVCTITALEGGALSGLVAYHGSAWWHPSVRGRLLGSIIARISRAYSYTRWRTDLSVAFNSNELVARGWPVRNGYRHIDPGVRLRNFAIGDYDGAVVWITAEELISDLSAFMSQLEARLKSDNVLRTA
ncbi:MAG: hypothetical protein JSS20_07360 [Proteobacteria bacterium]|nr:hypothetical protein [Pseudomonadota bacterium]